MMTFCLSLRTTETMCILPSFSLVHTCVAAQRGILTLLFHKRRKNLTTRSNGALPAFFISELLLLASKTAKVTGENNTKVK